MLVMIGHRMKVKMGEYTVQLPNFWIQEKYKFKAETTEYVLKESLWLNHYLKLL